MKKITLFLFGMLVGVPFSFNSKACTNILVSKGASKDGSVIITYSCDGEFLAHLQRIPAQDHQPGEYLKFTDRNGKVHKIIQKPHTYAVVGLMNEFQLSIGETTFDGRTELQNPNGALHYWTLMNLALQRARTAREAIKVMGNLVANYGYASTGETFSLADPEEAWIMEMVGSGPGGKGANWVALRIPDGAISAHANMSRIGTFPLDDPENCLYSKNVISFATKKGYYLPKSGKPFSFRDAYDVVDAGKLRYCATRVWSIFRRSAPSLNLSSDFNRGIPNTNPYPLWIKPDHKLSVHDVMMLMRDHYEGTPFDMTKGLDAGPYHSPNRWRPINWSINDKRYAWERPISTQQTAFSFVSQARTGFPNGIGGVLWYGMDDTYTTCYIPLYCKINEVPKSFAEGDIQKFSWNSAWWVFNFVANIANLKYVYMIKDIQDVQKELEKNFFAMQPAIETTALALYKTDPELMQNFLTDYSISCAEKVVKRWKQLGEDLLTKYNDGYIKDENGRPRSMGYPDDWLKRVIQSDGDHFILPKK